MRAAQWITCCWPGLTSLWLQGSLRGLALAVVFTGLLNAALSVQFLWSQVISQQGLAVLWGLVFLAWCGGFWQAARQVYRTPPRRAPRAEVDLFIQAQGEYLKGHWFEAEAVLERLLRFEPDDVDAHLMLASLYRHTNRYAEAGERLRHLRRLDGAEKWHLEIAQELERLERLAAEATDEAANEATDEAAKDSQPEASATSSSAGPKEGAAESSRDNPPGRGEVSQDLESPGQSGTPEQSRAPEQAGKPGQGDQIGVSAGHPGAGERRESEAA